MNSIFKNTVIYTIGRTIPQLSGLILLPIFTNHMSPEEYGIVQAMMIISAVLLIFFTLATERSVFRLIHDYKTIYEQKKLIGNMTVLITAVSIILVLLLFLFRDQVHLIYSNIDFHPYFTYAILSAFCSVFIVLPNNVLQVREKAIQFTTLSTLNFALSSAFMLYFVIVQREQGVGMLKGQLIANACMLIIYIPLIFKQSTFGVIPAMQKNILSYSLPMIPSLLSAWVLSMSNRIFIEQYINLHDVGIYSTAFKISSIATMLAGAYFSAYVPIFYKYANSDNLTASRQKLEKLNFYYAISTLVICFLISLASKELISWLLPQSYNESYKIIPLLTLSVVFAQISGLFNLMLYQNKKNTQVMFIIMVSAAISLILNYLLIPLYGIYGAAVGTVLGTLCNLIIISIFARKSFYVDFKYLFIGLTILISYSIVFLDQRFNTLNIFLSLACKTIVSLVVVYFIIIKNKEKIFIRK